VATLQYVYSLHHMWVFLFIINWSFKKKIASSNIPIRLWARLVKLMEKDIAVCSRIIVYRAGPTLFSCG